MHRLTSLGGQQNTHTCACSRALSRTILRDVVQNADLTERVEIFAVLCTFVSDGEFDGLAEQLGVGS